MIAALTALMAIPANGEYVTAMSGLVIRDGPGIEFEQVGLLGFADEVEGEITDGWMKIENGYVSADYLSEDNPLDDCQNLGSWLLTAYGWTGNRCADGSWPEVGWSVATNSLPLGSMVYISGYGVKKITDRGPSNMPSFWLDVYLGDEQTCIDFGEKYSEVFLLSTP